MKSAAAADFNALIAGLRCVDDPPPLLGPDGRITFDPRSHAKRLESTAGYSEWWHRLSEIELRRYQAQHQAHLAELEDEAAAAARRARQDRLEELRLSGVPKKDRERIVHGRLDSTPALEAARAFLDSGATTILILAGPPGSGKTTASSWLVAQQGARGGLFVDQSRLVRRSRYKDEDMAPLEGAGLLVIDDLGSEFADAKGSFLATLDGLINARYGEQRRTVITTNLASARFVARYGERIADRIREVGRFVELRAAGLRSARGAE